MFFSAYCVSSVRRLQRLAYLSSLALCLAGTALAEHDAPLSLNAAVAAALAGNPGLEEIRARAEAMAAVPDQEGALPDPTLSFSALNLPSGSFNLHRDDMTMLETGISQEIPFPGKRALKEQAARHEAEAAADSAEEAKLRLVRDVKIRWWQLFYMNQALHITDDSVTLLDQLAAAARARYEAGTAPQQDWLQARLERAKLDQQQAGHYAMHHGETARLETLMGGSVGGHISLPASVDAPLPDVPPTGELFAAAEQNHPFLTRKRQDLDAAQSRLALAEKGYYPDFNLGAGYAVRQTTPTGDSRSDFVNFRLSMNLPLYAGQKQDKAVDQRQSELLQSRYGLEDADRKLRSDLAVAHAAYQGAKRQFQSIAGDLIPIAEQAAEVAVAAYRSGGGSFGEAIRAYQTLYEYRMLYWQTLAEAQQALAKLAFAAGKEAL